MFKHTSVTFTVADIMAETEITALVLLKMLPEFLNYEPQLSGLLLSMQFELLGLHLQMLLHKIVDSQILFFVAVMMLVAT